VEKALTEKYQPLITDKILSQILTIRSEGKFNMFDIIAIQREAFDKGFYELAIFIKEHKKEYVHFILTGKR